MQYILKKLSRRKGNIEVNRERERDKGGGPTFPVKKLRSINTEKLKCLLIVGTP